MRAVVGVALAALAAVSCSGSAATRTPLPRFDHVLVVVLENKSQASVLGNREAPNFNNFAKQYAVLSHYGGVAHPSLPNYLALVSGSTHGITTDCTTCFLNAPNIAVTPVPIVRRTQDGFDVVMEARARPNYVMVARVAGRMVLHNGVHKVLALKKRSRARVFALVYDVQNVAQLQLPGAQSSTFLDANYIQAARPPLERRGGLWRACITVMRPSCGIRLGDVR